eukprot:jgi/Galph1/3895/GphlegSOOS_G2568.1
MALVQLQSLKVFARKPMVTWKVSIYKIKYKSISVLMDFLTGRWKMASNVELEHRTLNNKFVLVTGCNSGIGYALCYKLAKAGARLIICCRSLEKADETVDKLKKDLHFSNETGRFWSFGADFQDLLEVKQLAERVISLNVPLHCLILNAGIMQAPKKKTTKDGLELHFGVNHMSHFLLTYLLVPLLVKSAPSRVIILTSTAYEYGRVDRLQDHSFQVFSYSPVMAYAQSKLSNLLFGYELRRKLRDKGVQVYTVHPGAVLTNIYRDEWILHSPIIGTVSKRVLPLFMRTPSEAAKTIEILVVYQGESMNDNFEDFYWKDCQPCLFDIRLINASSAKYLWNLSLSILMERNITKDYYF